MMSQAVNVRVNNSHGWALLQELEAIGVLSIEKGVQTPLRPFNGKQFRGIVPSDEIKKFKSHIDNIRNEWERDI